MHSPRRKLENPWTVETDQCSAPHRNIWFPCRAKIVKRRTWKDRTQWIVSPGPHIWNGIWTFFLWEGFFCLRWRKDLPLFLKLLLRDQSLHWLGKMWSLSREPFLIWLLLIQRIAPNQTHPSRRGKCGPTYVLNSRFMKPEQWRLHLCQDVRGESTSFDKTGRDAHLAIINNYSWQQDYQT